MAMVPIWIGSFRSLDEKAVKPKKNEALPSSPSNANKKSIFSFSLVNEPTKAETLKAKDAYMFPIIGSGVLLGLYIVFKVFSKEYVNLLLTAYFLFFGIFAVSATIRPYLVPLFPKSIRNKEKEPNLFKLWSIEFKWTVVDLVATVLAFALGIWYVLTKHWIANNILGISFSIQGVSMLSLGSYQIGCILLVLLPSIIFYFLHPPL